MSFSPKTINYSSIPLELRSTFRHLYFDIGWLGVLSGSAVNFLNVYATRLGASAYQIGLVGAAAAFISLIFALPAGRWIDHSRNKQLVFWASVIYRIGFLFYIPLPLLFNAQGQIWVLIVISLLMGIPLVGLSVGFSALFAEAVPFELRAHVAGTRNIVLSVMFMITSLVSGFLLDHVIFPLNYQIVFLIGFLGAMMSSYHLFFIRPIDAITSNSTNLNSTNQLQGLIDQSDKIFQKAWKKVIRLDILTTKFRTILFVMMIFHIAQYLALPVFPLFFVRYLKLSDQNLGIGTALFYLAVLIGSTQLSRLVNNLGHKDVTGWGVIGMAIYPGLLAFSDQVWQFYIISILGGLAWALAGGASTNYVIERCPENDRPAHLAWYNIILNTGILIWSILGPVIAENFSLPTALILFSLARGLAGYEILKWGE